MKVIFGTTLENLILGILMFLIGIMPVFMGFQDKTIETFVIKGIGIVFILFAISLNIRIERKSKSNKSPEVKR